MPSVAEINPRTEKHENVMQPTANPTSAVEGDAGQRAPARLAIPLLLLAILIVPAVFERTHRGRIFPGVSAAGVPLGGLEPTEALAALAEAGLDPQARVIFHAADESFELAPAASGMTFDARATVASAYATGREGFRLVAWARMLAARLGGRAVHPVVLLDEDRSRLAIAEIARQFDRPAQDASLAIDGTTVKATEPRAGRRIDQAAALETLRPLADAGSWPLPDIVLPVESVPPEVGDASQAIADAEALLAAPLTLRAGHETWSLRPQPLGAMLRTSVSGNVVVLDLDRESFTNWLTTVTEVVSRTAQNPRFHFDPEVRQLRLVQPGRTGQRLMMAETVRRVLAAAHSPNHLVRLAVESIPPSVRDGASASELGIRELVHEETSRFVGSPEPRKQNIALAAARFDGLLIPPGAVFSFNQHVGEITAEEGFQETKIIMDGATADGVGGGVCQVSTTLFRAVFWSGLPVVERLAHGYRVAYYEQGADVGLDATVYGPIVDLKFENDTGAWLLIETESSSRAATVTFRFYGAKPAREVRMEGPVITDEEPPPEPRTEIDPTLAPGDSETLELARSGASVTVTRIITQGGEEIRENFYSKYRPTGSVTTIGPPLGETGVGAEAGAQVSELPPTADTALP